MILCLPEQLVPEKIICIKAFYGGCGGETPRDREDCDTCGRRLWTAQNYFGERMHLGQTVHFERIPGKHTKATLVHIAKPRALSEQREVYGALSDACMEGQTIVRWLQYDGYNMTEDSIVDVENLGLQMLRLSLPKRRGRATQQTGAAESKARKTRANPNNSAPKTKKAVKRRRRQRACFLCGFVANTGAGTKLVVHPYVPFNTDRESNYLCRKCEKLWFVMKFTITIL